jgi:hypothetical protein
LYPGHGRYEGFFQLQVDAADFPKAVGKLFGFFAQEVVGFDDADAFGKIQHRPGEVFALFLTIMGFPQRIFPRAVAEGQGGNFCLRGNGA